MHSPMGRHTVPTLVEFDDEPRLRPRAAPLLDADRAKKAGWRLDALRHPRDVLVRHPPAHPDLVGFRAGPRRRQEFDERNRSAT